MAGNTLTKKLLVQENQTLAVLNAPEGFWEQLRPLPSKTSLDKSLRGSYDWILLFAYQQADLEKWAAAAVKDLNKDGILWIAYPKKTSKIKTDLSRDHGWSVLEKLQFQAVSLIAIDETWSAARFRTKTAIAKNKKSSSTLEFDKISDYIDVTKRTVELPLDFKQALQKNKKAATFFEHLSFTNRKEYVVGILQAKKEETRKARILLYVQKLEAGLKNPFEKP